MSDSDKLEEILQFVRNSAALNGGFNTLTKTVNSIKECQSEMAGELKVMSAAQLESSKKIEDMHHVIYTPDTGLITKIERVMGSCEDNDERLSNIETKTEEIENTTANIDVSVRSIALKNETLMRIAGQDFEEVQANVKARKNVSRMFWVVAAAAGAGLGKLIWDIIATIFP